jgi:hypothetical protein
MDGCDELIPALYSSAIRWNCADEAGLEILVAGAGFGSHFPVLGPLGRPLRERRHFTPGKMVNLRYGSIWYPNSKYQFIASQLCESRKIDIWNW